MSARKLQQEMDRVFKRVLEGTQLFDQIYEKLQNSANQTQKEKLEADLKKELKKLQKLRDQIKTWLGSNDIRDKKQLMEQRRLIENEMERFKVVEREIKQKTWQSSPEDDPHFEEKKDTCDFLQTQIDVLEEQTVELEQEEESLQTSKRGKRDHAKQDRIAEIEHQIERNKYHVHSMEIMIRMIENDTLAFEAVDDLRDDILYYVESNQDVDFAEDEAIYDDLGLVEDDEDEVETIVRDDTYTLEDLAQDLSKEREEKSKEEKEKEREKKKRGQSPASNTPPPASLPGSAPGTPVSAPAPAVVASPAHVPAPMPAPTLASLVSQPPRTASPALYETTPKKQTTPPPSIYPLRATSAPGARTGTPVKTGTAATSGSAGSGISGTSNGVLSGVPGSAPIGTSSGTSIAPSGASSGAPSGTPSGGASSGTGTSTGLAAQAAADFCFPDLLPVTDTLSKRVSDGTEDLGKKVDVSFLHCPDAASADRPRYYYVESPYPTPEYYPNELLPTLDDPAIFAAMDLDTLFYIFYYRQGAYQQYLAARELKSRSWRFHKRFLTWFQRHEDPKTINPEFEQGTYRFFDFEGSWLQRRKSNFKFEYQYLEDEI